VIADPVQHCRGDGRCREAEDSSRSYPAGRGDSTRIPACPAEGEAGARGGPSGDLYIFVHLARHSVFQRDGTTLFARCPVSFTTAALGGTIEVPGLDKQRHAIRIPAGIQSGKQLRQRGAGMTILNGRGHGDMVIQVEVETPTKLSPRQKELLEEFRKTETGDECPASKSFFGKLKSLWEA
jgi:molecular chaperone DnaJ